MSTYARKVRLYPTRRRAVLSSNLPISDAVGIYTQTLEPRLRSGFAAHCKHLVEFFGSLRLRSIHRLQFSEYARHRIKQGAARSTIEHETAMLRLLTAACYNADLASDAAGEPKPPQSVTVEPVKLQEELPPVKVQEPPPAKRKAAAWELLKADLAEVCR